MKKILSVIFCALMLALSCAVASAAEAGKSFYIDPVAGNDENDGTSPDCAWQTTARANREVFSAGDSIFFKRGCRFEGTFITNGSGSEAEPITVSAYGEGADPVIFTDTESPLFIISDVSDWIVEDLEFTAPNGIGMMIYAVKTNTTNITVRNCYFHDISPDGDNNAHAALFLNSASSEARLQNIRIDSVRIENTAWGIHCKGENYENSKDTFVSPENDYNSDYTFENIFIRNAKKGGIVIAAVMNCLVKNCRVLDCATAQDSAYAPLWIRHSQFVTVEYCEIAGSTNKTDGMAIDFDGWTTDSVYRYIYSHDNNRFIKNCVFDRKTKNARNEVCHCVSVNDNQRINWSAISLISSSAPSFSSMKDFSFHDNVIINSKPIIWVRTPKVKIENVTFIGSSFLNLRHKFFNLFSFSKGFTYQKDGDAAELIAEITKNLPQ